MNDGGPAFPCKAISSTEIGKEGIQMISRLPANGMSLRDWFAGMALSGILARGGAKGEDGAETNAMDAYASANAMIGEREK